MEMLKPGGPLWTSNNQMADLNPLAYLRNRTAELDSACFTACNQVLDSVAFQECVGGSTRHHAYPAGLAQHTAEVLEYCLFMAVGRFNAPVNREVLITAAIFHDCMKVRDYEVGGDYREKIRHVAGSFAFWVKTAEDLGIAQETIDQVGHCILAHHGRQEWGSPVEPQTIEAFILHSADMLSMQYGWKR